MLLMHLFPRNIFISLNTWTLYRKEINVTALDTNQCLPQCLIPMHIQSDYLRYMPKSMPYSKINFYISITFTCSNLYLKMHFIFSQHFNQINFWVKSSAQFKCFQNNRKNLLFILLHWDISDFQLITLHLIV